MDIVGDISLYGKMTILSNVSGLYGFYFTPVANIRQLHQEAAVGQTYPLAGWCASGTTTPLTRVDHNALLLLPAGISLSGAVNVGQMNTAISGAVSAGGVSALQMNTAISGQVTDHSAATDPHAGYLRNAPPNEARNTIDVTATDIAGVVIEYVAPRSSDLLRINETSGPGIDVVRVTSAGLLYATGLNATNQRVSDIGAATAMTDAARFQQVMAVLSGHTDAANPHPQYSSGGAASGIYPIDIGSAEQSGSDTKPEWKAAGTNVTHSGWGFDAGSTESIQVGPIKATWYTSGHIAVQLHWSPDNATTNSVLWHCNLSVYTPGDAIDLEADAWATGQTGLTTNNGTNQSPHLTTIIVSGLDSLARNDLFFLRIQRLGGDTSDNMANDAILEMVSLQYTN